MKRLHSVVCRSKMDFSCQLYSSVSPGRIIKQHAQIRHVETKYKHSNIVESSQLKDTRKQYNIQRDIRTLLERGCEVKNVMRYLKDIGVLEEI